ncbi:MAG TPA: DUF4097 family beta strand repeat-containing protein [Candidatus Angelobacter sp.]|nr:DUF4097 family beta strand repeat-containing protein [Candidatus Angelobacter sp.]
MSTPSPVPPQPPSYYRPRPRSIFGPLVLISLGVLFLLRTTGVIQSQSLHLWFARYWPLLLIVWGAAKLLEHLWARHRGEPTPRLGGGSIVFLVFFILFATGFSRTYNWNWGGMGDDWNWGHGWDPFNNRYEYTDNFAQPLTGANQIKVLCNQGDITVSASEDDQAHAVVHKTVRTDSQSNADRLNESTKPKFTQQGQIWLLDLTGGDFENTRFDLDLQLPRQAALSIATRRGNLSVSQRDGNVDLATDHGNASVEQVKGYATLRLNGDVTVKNVTGNVQIEGSVDDGDISDVNGTLMFNAGYNGNIQLARIKQQLHLKSVRTDLQLAKLDGELNMGHGDLQGSSISGPVKLTTRSNEVHLEDVSGEIDVENRNGVVELKAKGPLGPIDISNVHGGIELDLPENANFRLDAKSTSGNIDISDFSVNVDNSGSDATARGTVGKGGPDIRLRADRGTIQIRKQ